ncbi:MAG: glycine--tRNA ligase subunit beta, partial [Alphaproteobacteria bacterium]
MSEILLEIVSGEIPAGMQKKIAQNLANIFEAEIAKYVTQKGESNVFWSARRIGFCYEGFSLATAPSAEEVRGPKTSAPDVALEGFLKKYSLAKSDLYSQDHYYFAKIIHKSVSPQELLESILKKILSSITWPKSMKWNGDETWVRPIYSILAQFNGNILKFQYGNIQSSNTTLGHRIYSN